MGLRNAVMGLGALGMLVYSHPGVMVQVLGVVFLVVLPAMWYGRRVRKLSRASQDRVADASALAAEVLNAIPLVQSYTAEDREAQRFAQSTQQAFDTATRRSRARAVLVAFIIIANAALVLWGLYQGTQAVLAGRMSAGELGQAAFYVVIFAGAVAVLGEVYGDLLRAAGASERLMELLATQSPVQSPAHPVSAPWPTGGSAVVFENLTFHYPSRPAQAALSGFSLAVQPGQTVALVGPSGAGKSTVFGLLLRHYDAALGHTLLDGVPTQDMALDALRGRIGIVPQDAVIFSANAMDNIRYGKPDATDGEVLAAAVAAHADEFIARLPEGYHTFLGERGVRLSGGQRQRIAIARAILKNPPLLLLDEATSALDAQSEHRVQQALAAAMQNRTTLVIAHRLATVQKADLIVVLDHGQVVERGTHAELVAAGGVYARLAALQFQP
jgi:ATP-binding cassette subfamily B protein